MRWAQRRCFARSRRTTCAGSAAAATGARPGRTDELAKFLSACSLRLAQHPPSASEAPHLAAVVPAAVQPETCPAAQGLQMQGGFNSRRSVRRASGQGDSSAAGREAADSRPTPSIAAGQTEWGNPFPDRRGIYPHRGAGSISQGVLGPRATHDTGESAYGRSSRRMITCPAGACWTSPATWMSTSGAIFCAAQSHRDVDGRYCLSMQGRVCTGTSPSRVARANCQDCGKDVRRLVNAVNVFRHRARPRQANSLSYPLP